METKRMLIIGGNFFPEPTGIGKYTGEMAGWLANNGYEVTAVTTYPYYPYWKVQQPYTKSRYWFKTEITTLSETNNVPVKVIRCPHYVPAKPTGLKRIISDFSILFSSFLVVFRLLFGKKYDYVLSVAPPFQLGLLAVLYKKTRGAKLLYHIQDLQIDAAQDLGMIRSKVVIKILFSMEKYILRQTDFVSSISSGMIDRIKTKME